MRIGNMFRSLKCLFGKANQQLNQEDGTKSGKYKMFICSDSEIKRYHEYLETAESHIWNRRKASCHYVNEPFAYSTDVQLPSKNRTFHKFYYYYLRKIVLIYCSLLYW